MTFGDSRLPERFWTKVKVDEASGCWNWTAAVLREYGRFRFGPDGTFTKLAYRGAYLLLVGPVAPDKELDHRCKNKLCVNPAHLEQVTHKENIYRGGLPAISFLLHAAKTHCPKGHPYDEANTYRPPSKPNSRQCRACERARRLRKKASSYPRHTGEARCAHGPPAVGG